MTGLRSLNFATLCARLTLVLPKDRQRSEQNLKCLLPIAGRVACGFQHQNPWRAT